MAHKRSITTGVGLFRQRHQPSFTCLFHEGCEKHNSNESDPSRMTSKAFLSLGYCHTMSSAGFSAPFRRRDLLLSFSPAIASSFCGYSSSAVGEGPDKIGYISDVAEILTEKSVEVGPVMSEVAIAAADSSYPVAALQYVIDGVHSFTGLNWWASIALTTFIIRGATVPLLINQLKSSSKLARDVEHDITLVSGEPPPNIGLYQTEIMPRYDTNTSTRKEDTFVVSQCGKDVDVLESSRSKSYEEVAMLMREVHMINDSNCQEAQPKKTNPNPKPLPRIRRTIGEGMITSPTTEGGSPVTTVTENQEREVPITVEIGELRDIGSRPIAKDLGRGSSRPDWGCKPGPTQLNTGPNSHPTVSSSTTILSPSNILNPDTNGRLSVEKVALFSGHESELIRPQLEEISEQLKGMDPKAVEDGQKKSKALFKKYGVTPFTPLKGLLIQGPIFISFFLGIRNMVEKVPSFKEGGAFWFTDLTTPDSLYIFPVLTALTFLITVEFNMQEGMEGNPAAVKMKKFSRVLAFLTIPFTMGFPKGIFCYWCTSNLFSVIYGFVIRRPQVKKFLNLPEFPKQPTTPTASKPAFSIFSAFKSLPETKDVPPSPSEPIKLYDRRISSTHSVLNQRIRSLEKQVKGKKKNKKR
ncbi:hypothetical protein GIB67_042268 [Kingdonia uniflora]|uniref:Membrane insertase YidC/Oxa/ALB C-terminal domain-containing protein n=1 Tax=Kingdonia uniflora TaxID=39325 RepID=A0A7J7LE02_9MAGN|nr:hypothetical protein GIB67_042268 [Kingdonia uniflora]